MGSRKREALLNLTALVYKELEGYSVPVWREMLQAYYESLK